MIAWFALALACFTLAFLLLLVAAVALMAHKFKTQLGPYLGLLAPPK